MSVEAVAAAKGFFDAVLPDQGYLFLVRFTQKRKQHIATTKQAFLQALTQEVTGKRLETAEAVYFTPNSFHTRHTVDATGRKKTGRKADNAAYSRSLFVDLDCGEDKPYKTKIDALSDLKRFCKASGIPMPTAIVDSGRGVHCYWIFSEDIARERWLLAAQALKRVAAHHQFAIDPVCTTDAARILRVPGSLNRKTEPPSTVKVLGFSETQIQDFDEFLQHFEIPATSIFGTASDNDELALPEEYKIPAFMKGVVEKCPLMNQVAEDHGKWCSEPLWKAVLQVAWFAKDGEEWAHRLSDGHPEYDFTATQAKFEERANSMGPATCEQLQQAAIFDGRDFCSQCPHRGEIKSPIKLGMDPKTPVVTEDGKVYPRGFTIRDDGVYKLLEGDEQRIISLRMDNLRITEFETEEGVWEVLFSFDFWTDKQYTATLSQKLLADKRGLYQALVGQRVSLLSNKELDWFILLMNAWIDTLRRAGRVTTEDAKFHFGWAKPDEFVIGDRIITKNEHKPLSVRNIGTMAPLYTPCGSLDTWRQAAALFEGIPQLETVVATAFASPLLAFTNVSGAIVSITSRKSGVGKSSALKVAQAVWGHPVKGINALDDTEKSIFAKIGVLHDLPAYWDELRGKFMINKFSKMAFRLSQGKGMSRLNRNAALREIQDWQVMLTCASNNSLLDYLDAADQQSAAGAMRLFEFYADDVKLHSSKFNEAAKLLTQLETNFGKAGMEYAEWLVRNRSAAEKAVDTMISHIIKEKQCPQEERFWVVTIATLLVGASIANRLGLTNFSITSMKQFLLDTLDHMREQLRGLSASMTFLDILAVFLRENSNGALITDRLHVHGKPKGEGYQIYYAPPERMTLLYRLAKDDKVVRVPMKVFNEWARKNDYNPRQLIRMATEENLLIGRHRAFLAAGTMYASSREWCYDFSLTTLRLAVSKLDVAVDDSVEEDLNSSEE